MRQISMMIDNQKVVSSEGINFGVCNPANGNRIASVAVHRLKMYKRLLVLQVKHFLVGLHFCRKKM